MRMPKYECFGVDSAARIFGAGRCLVYGGAAEFSAIRSIVNRPSRHFQASVAPADRLLVLALSDFP